MPITTATATKRWQAESVCYAWWVPDSPLPCLRQQELIGEVQHHLIRLSDLARAEVEAVRSKDDKELLSIDKEIEATLGEKERSLGALREHRREHGC
jgi:hypothetical protein